MAYTLSTFGRLGATPALALGLLLFGLPACSSMPDQSWPPQREGRVEVVYEFDAEGPRPVAVPASGHELTVLELVTYPPAVGETFVDGHRFLVPPPNAPELRIACRYVVYGESGARDPFATTPSILDAFPGARLVEQSVQD